MTLGGRARSVRRMRQRSRLEQLPENYALALRLQSAGADHAVIAARLGIATESVGPLLEVAAAKLARAEHAPAPHAGRAPGAETASRAGEPGGRPVRVPDTAEASDEAVTARVGRWRRGGGEGRKPQES